MKRVRQTYCEKNNIEEIKGLSGVIELKGEDLSYEARQRFLQQQQRAWLDQQIKEKKERAQCEKENDRMYDFQTLEIDKIRGQLESEFHNKKKNIEATTKTLNLGNACEKKVQEKLEKQKKIEEERREIEEVISRGMKRVFAPQNQF